MKYFVLFIVILVVFGCDRLIDINNEGVIGVRKVSIKTEELPKGDVNKNYLAEIETEILFHNNDDIYPRKVILKDGDLPDGLVFESQENIGIIHGVPLEAGSFKVRVEAYSNELYQDLSAQENEKSRDFNYYQIVEYILEIN